MWNRQTSSVRRTGALLAALALLAGCAAPPAEEAAPVDLAQISEGQLGLTPFITMREIMRYIVDPTVDVIFNAVAYDTLEDGQLMEIVPETDEDWFAIEAAAYTVAEGMNLMKMPRAVAPGDQNLAPNPGELPPAEVEANIAAQRLIFNAYADALAAEALRVVEIAQARDIDALFEAGSAIDAACENCHLPFWYPGDRNAVERFNTSETFQAAPGSEIPATPPASTPIE
jgi:hypothetical protein